MSLYSENNPQYITTIDDAWLVAIRVPDTGRLVTKTFRPKTENNLQKAISWRDRAYRRLFGKAVPKRIFHQSLKDTATGIPGVRFQIKKFPRKNGNTYQIPVIIAEVHTIPGSNYARPRGSRSRVYSLNKYEWDEAVTLGAAWRREMIEQLEKQQVE